MSRPFLESFLIILSIVLANSVVSVTAFLLIYYIGKLKKFTIRNYLLYTSLCFLPGVNILMIIIVATTKEHQIQPYEGDPWENYINKKL